MSFNATRGIFLFCKYCTSFHTHAPTMFLDKFGNSCCSIRVQNKLYDDGPFLLINLCLLFPFDSSVSSWLQHARSSQVLKSVDAQPRSFGTWWCRSAVCPSSTSGTTMAEWASLNRETPPWASCTGMLQPSLLPVTIRE